jgi:hypothetical protein
MDIVMFVVCSFAVYRVATDFAWMTGPFHLFEYARGWVIQKFGFYHWITEGFQCPICLSFWIASPIIYTHGVVEWLGVAGASAILARAFPPRD